MIANGRNGTTLAAMAKTYRPYVPEQDLLLPPSLRDWLPEGHLAFFVSDLIDQLDLSAITSVYEQDERGYPPYHPVMMTKVLVTHTASACSRPAGCTDGWSRTSRSACWPPATCRTTARSGIFGSGT